jgi:hypothetical protein
MLLLQPLYIIYTIIGITIYQLEVLRRSLSEFYSVYCCAYSADTLYYRYNQEWLKEIKSNYIVCVSGDRSDYNTIEGFGFTLKESEEQLTINKGSNYVSDIKKRESNEGILWDSSSCSQYDSSNGDGYR